MGTNTKSSPGVKKVKTTQYEQDLKDTVGGVL